LRLEIPEIYYQKFDYFTEIYNVFDISQPILFTIHLILRIIYGKLEDFEWMRLADNLVEIFIITGSTIKLISYIRYKEEYSFFVQMFFAVLEKLLPFLMIFAILIIVFTIF
jgi:hypothetical protein